MCPGALRPLVLVVPFVAALCLTAAAATADPPEVAALERYLDSYRQSFSTLLAEEASEQTSYERGRAIDRRVLRGEFFTTFTSGTQGWMSVHDVMEVDGHQVTDRVSVRTLLADRSIANIGPELARVNSQYNIGSIARNFNEPTLPLQLLDARWRAALTFSRRNNAATDTSERSVTLEARLRRDAPFIRNASGRIATTRATFIVEPVTGRIIETGLVVDDSAVTATLRTQYAHEPRLDVWVPVRFTERYERGGEVTAVATTFTNYRRFETSGRVLP